MTPRCWRCCSRSGHPWSASTSGSRRVEPAAALRAAGIVLLGCATNPDEARSLEQVGVSAIVAQGYEAGGHRGVMDPESPSMTAGCGRVDAPSGGRVRVPVIAAGGIMDGAGIAAVHRAWRRRRAARDGVRWLPESQRRRGLSCGALRPGGAHTVMTRIISGRPARCLANGFTRLAQTIDQNQAAAYPLAYAAGRALGAAARARARPASRRNGQGRVRRSRARCRPRSWWRCWMKNAAPPSRTVSARSPVAVAVAGSRRGWSAAATDSARAELPLPRSEPPLDAAAAPADPRGRGRCCAG